MRIFDDCPTCNGTGCEKQTGCDVCAHQKCAVCMSCLCSDCMARDDAEWEALREHWASGTCKWVTCAECARIAPTNPLTYQAPKVAV